MKIRFFALVLGMMLGLLLAQVSLAQTPSALSPDNVIGLGYPINFTWQATDYYPILKYQIQIDEDTLFTSPVIDAETTYPYYSGTGLGWHKGIFWRVRSYYRSGLYFFWSSWSQRAVFGTCEYQVMTSLTSPASGTLRLTQPITLDWVDVGSPSSYIYWLQVDNNSDFSSPERTIEISARCSEYVINGLADGETHYWRVKVWMEDPNSPGDYKYFNYCSPWNFQTKGLGDVNCDGNINALDITRLINFLYKGAAPPYCF